MDKGVLSPPTWHGDDSEIIHSTVLPCGARLRRGAVGEHVLCKARQGKVALLHPVQARVGTASRRVHIGTQRAWHV